MKTNNEVMEAFGWKCEIFTCERTGIVLTRYTPIDKVRTVQYCVNENDGRDYDISEEVFEFIKKMMI